MKKADRRSHRPALQALLILIAALILTVFIVKTAGQMFDTDIPLPAFALLQGLLAAMLAFMCGMAWWWSVILAVFPVAMLLVGYLQLPPVFFLIVFLILLVVFWTTFRSQVPFYPSTQRVWDEVYKLLPAEKAFRFIDIGSGFGGAVLNLSGRCPNGQFTGIEIAPLPWLVSAIRAKISRSSGGFIRGDYTRLDFARYDVVFAYLSPAAMPALWDKASAEMAKGSLLLSYEFVLDEKKPDFMIKTRENGETLYGWNM
jgi:SAM-dependent methyltransferase